MFDHHTRTCILENVSPKMPLNGGHPDAHHPAKDGNPHHEQLGLCHLSAPQYVILPLHHVSTSATYEYYCITLVLLHHVSTTASCEYYCIITAVPDHPSLLFIHIRY